MTDVITKKQRSYNMSRIHSKWTKPEKIVHNYLKGNKIKHKMHPKLLGNPDIIIPEKNLAVFIHGCFWHKCSKCKLIPDGRLSYWKKKLNANAVRDRKNILALRRHKFKVKVIWEHDLKRINKILPV